MGGVALRQRAKPAPFDNLAGSLRLPVDVVIDGGEASQKQVDVDDVGEDGARRAEMRPLARILNREARE